MRMKTLNHVNSTKFSLNFHVFVIFAIIFLWYIKRLGQEKFYRNFASACEKLSFRVIDFLVIYYPVWCMLPRASTKKGCTLFNRVLCLLSAVCLPRDQGDMRCCMKSGMCPKSSEERRALPQHFFHIDLLVTIFYIYF